MTKEELIDLINNSEDCYSVWDAEDLIPGSVKRVAKWLEPESFRWFLTATNVYKCEDGFVGVYGVIDLKSEMIGYVDCDIKSQAFEVKQVPGMIYELN